MTDQPNAVVPPGDFSVDQIASARGAWQTAGHDVSTFDSALSGQTIDPEPASAIPEPIQVNDLNQPALSRAEMLSARQSWLELGFDAAQFDEAAKADGFVVESTVGSEEAAAREEYGLPKMTPDDYRGIDYGPAAVGLDTTALARLDAEARSWLAATGMPPELGRGFIENAIAASQRWERLTDVERTIVLREARAAFIQSVGEDRAAAVEAQAASVLQRAPASFGLSLKGALNTDPWLAITLGNFGAWRSQAGL